MSATSHRRVKTFSTCWLWLWEGGADGPPAEQQSEMFQSGFLTSAALGTTTNDLLRASDSGLVSRLVWFGPDTVPPCCSCLFRGQPLGFPSSGGTISTGTDAQICKDELEMNRSQAETQHANPISWPRSRASPLGISTVYRHMLRRPDGALLCRTDILRMHVCIWAVNPPTVNDRWLLDLKSSLLVFRVTWPRSGSLALRPVDDGSICSGT